MAPVDHGAIVRRKQRVSEAFASRAIKDQATVALTSVDQPDRIRTTDVRARALNASRRRTHLERLGGPLEPPGT